MKHSSLCTLSLSQRVLWGTLSSPVKSQLVKFFLSFLSCLAQPFFFFFLSFKEWVKFMLAMTSQGKRE